MRLEPSRLIGARVRACLTAVAWSLTTVASWAQQTTDASSLYEKLSPSVWTVVVSGGAGRSLGSAVVVAPGRLVTNCHVLSGGRTIEITHSNVSYGARLLAPDAARDLCLLSVENFHAPAVEIAPSASIKIGQRVYTIGSPLGQQNTLGDGLVSGFASDSDGVPHWIQFSAPISHGSSGGGLFDVQGKLVGLTTSLVDPSKAEYLNRAVPAEWIRDVPARAELQLASRRQRQASEQASRLGILQTEGPLPAPQAQQGPGAVPPADFLRVTTSGNPILVSFHGAWARNTCQLRFVPRITIVQSPVHGRIEIKEGGFPIESSNSGPCNGQTITGVQVFYVPNADFKGRETFRYISSGNPFATKTAIVEVR
jgi:hypothetical protein